MLLRKISGYSEIKLLGWCIYRSSIDLYQHEESSYRDFLQQQNSAGLKTWILAISTALAVLGTAPFAQAAIVKGTISGTWNHYTSSNAGDSFSATYSYDDAAIIPFNDFGIDYSDTGFNVVLSSLRVIGEGYDHKFDFTSGIGNGLFTFRDYAVTPPTYQPYSYRSVYLQAQDLIGSEYTAFFAGKSIGQKNGEPFVESSAQTYTYNSGIPIRGSTGVSDNFSPDPTAVTAVPTPALLPGLAAFGLGVWRKRKQAKQVEV